MQFWELPPGNLPFACGKENGCGGVKHETRSVEEGGGVEEEPNYTASPSAAESVLRRRKLEQRSSFLNDGYALIDSLQQEQQQHQGGDTEQSIDFATHPLPPPPVPQHHDRVMSRELDSLVSFASSVSNRSMTEQGRESSIEGDRSSSSKSYRHSSSGLTNEHFSTSLRRSIRVLKRQSIAASNNNIWILPSPSSTTLQQQGISTSPSYQSALEFNTQQQEQQQPDSETNAAAVAPSPADVTTTRRASQILQWSSILHLSAFATIGAMFRVFLGWLFSGAGSNCTTRGDSVWCVTYSTSALFVDLPANMVGSFLMGLLQKPSQDLRLAVAPDDVMGVAFLPSSHWFHEWGIYHMALRTGFCGSLTTFASWNTQMIRMMDGTAFGNSSQYVSALFGYVIGLQLALASLSLGQHVAIWLYRYTNPALAKEEDVLMYAYTKEAIGGGGTLADDNKNNTVAIKNERLPDYEMRYLASLLPNEERRWAMQNVAILESLERWKMSTDHTRLCGDPRSQSLRDLHQIEEAILVDETEPTKELLDMALEKGWDVKALQQFAEDAHGVSMPQTKSYHKALSGKPNARRLQTVVALIPFVLGLGLIALYLVLDLTSRNDPTSNDDKTNEHRKQWVTALFAPFGALLRWKLSRFNGKMSGAWNWFPLGTFAANMIACIISASVAGISDSSRSQGRVWEAFLHALKTGFAGSLSTVSSFVAEGNMMQTIYPHHAKAFYYMIGSLVMACGLGLLFYAPLVRTGPPT